MRGVGEFAVVDALPEALVAAFGALTHLGDPWVVLGGLALLYVVADAVGIERRRVAFVLGVGFVALGATLALKGGFALPRPPGAAEDGYGFPSGHAIGTTAVWGALVAAVTVGTRRRRVAVAGVAVVTVAVSRVVIGVHYLVDVVAGVAVGLALVALAWRVGPARDGRLSHAAVTRVFGLAAVLAVLAFAVAPSTDALVGVGATVGGALGWHLGDPTASTPAPTQAKSAVGLAGLPVVLGGLFAVETAAASLPAAAVVVGAAGCVAALLGLPRVAARLARLVATAGD